MGKAFDYSARALYAGHCSSSASASTSLPLGGICPHPSPHPPLSLTCFLKIMKPLSLSPVSWATVRDSKQAREVRWALSLAICSLTLARSYSFSRTRSLSRPLACSLALALALALALTRGVSAPPFRPPPLSQRRASHPTPLPFICLHPHF